MELPETYAWLDQVEQATGWEIARIGRDLERVIRGFNYLPAHRNRYCTRMTKIEPMEEFIGGDDAIVYYGLRADEERVGFRPSKKSRITPSYPLRDLGIDLHGVWTILETKDLLPPFFF